MSEERTIPYADAVKIRRAFEVAGFLFAPEDWLVEPNRIKLEIEARVDESHRDESGLLVIDRWTPISASMVASKVLEP